MSNSKNNHYNIAKKHIRHHRGTGIKNCSYPSMPNNNRPPISEALVQRKPSVRRRSMAPSRAATSSCRREYQPCAQISTYEEGMLPRGTLNDDRSTPCRTLPHRGRASRGGSSPPTSPAQNSLPSELPLHPGASCTPVRTRPSSSTAGGQHLSPLRESPEKWQTLATRRGERKWGTREKWIGNETIHGKRLHETRHAGPGEDRRPRWVLVGARWDLVVSDSSARGEIGTVWFASYGPESDARFATQHPSAF
jgi:hypothetical protein